MTLWHAQAIVLVLRVGSIAEIISKGSRRYPEFRTIAGRLIALVSRLLVCGASWAVVHNVTDAPVLILGVEDCFVRKPEALGNFVKLGASKLGSTCSLALLGGLVDTLKQFIDRDI